MNRIILTTASPDLESRVLDATGGSALVLPAGPGHDATADMMTRVDGMTTPGVVMLDTAAMETTAALDLAACLGERHPGTAVVLVSERASEIGVAAMRAGVRDIVHPDADALEMGQVLERTLRSVPPQQPAGGADPTRTPASPAGRVLSVVSPKGGVGKTTVAANLAVGLARAEPHSTVLVDLDLQFGDISSALNLAPEYTLVDAVQGSPASDTMVLKTFLTQHETGLYVLCGPESPADADIVETGDVRSLLRSLATEFRYVVVDTAPGLSDHTLAVMDQSSDLIMVTSMDVPGVRGLRKEIHVLDSLGTFSHSRHIVLNYADARSGLTRGDVEATLGTEVDVLLPRSDGAAASVNQGIPLMQSEIRDPATKQLRRLLGRFAPSAEPEAGRPTPGWLRGLFASASEEIEPGSRRRGRHRIGQGGR